MASRSWLVDSSRIASKIKSASDNYNSQKVAWKSNPSRACPNCHHVIDNSDVANDWPGLPKGVKFDPSDQEIIWHLLAKAGYGDLKPHPFIDEFIPTVNEHDGICYTHPKNLPGVKQDGSVSHFFHRAIKAYNTGTRKRRKIHDEDIGDVRWHKTGRTKPVTLDGTQRGCKKIMVLYGGKSQKTNWVMHQYHLGTEEDEKEGEYVISKIFYQQQPAKQGDKMEQDLSEAVSVTTPNVYPATPKSVTPEPWLPERQPISSAVEQEPDCVHMNSDVDFLGKEAQPKGDIPGCDDEVELESHVNQMAAECDEDRNENNTEEDLKWWEGSSQYVLDSQQLVEALSLCDDLLQSQSPNRAENANIGASTNKPCLSDYAELGKENFKSDLEECQNMDPDPANIDIDTPPDFRLSQLEFGSQESFLAWGTGKTFD